MTLADLRDALLAATTKVYHFAPPESVTGPYIVWAEDGQANASHGNNQMTVQVLTGTVDYFTKTEFDPNFDAIQAALNALKIAWRLNSIQYEEATKFLHYEWVWAFPQGVG